ncbi:hypothetical protein [Phocaeicola sp.]|uniref:hypothetical protein n=1 Tax=Phocaeicola sp. TaxID=2773926 RepID=UPI0023BFFEEF|nr:hypothetical protein [Phocaeicola sp.]MDE5677039.1 hypothetical protein [Phocaeicola sp.]
MKGPGGVSSHSRNPHRQGVSAENERMKGKAESHQCCILCEGATMQKMMASDNVGPKEDGNALVSAGEGSWPESNKTWKYRYHRLRCSYDYIGLTEYYQPEISADP